MGVNKNAKTIGSLQDPPPLDGSSVPLLWTLEEDGRVHEAQQSGDLELPPQHGESKEPIQRGRLDTQHNRARIEIFASGERSSSPPRPRVFLCCVSCPY